jgi:Dynein heavy chain AAA lid domain/Dynein heavy chain region D6 P-loop domain
MYEQDSLAWALSVSSVASAAIISIVKSAVEMNNQARGTSSLTSSLREGLTSSALVMPADITLLNALADANSSGTNLPSFALSAKDKEATEAAATKITEVLDLKPAQKARLLTGLAMASGMMGDAPNNWVLALQSLGADDALLPKLRDFARGAADVCPSLPLSQDSVARLVASSIPASNSRNPSASAILSVSRVLGASCSGCCSFLAEVIGPVRQAVLSAILRPEKLGSHLQALVRASAGKIDGTVDRVGAAGADTTSASVNSSGASTSSPEVLAQLIVTSPLSLAPFQRSGSSALSSAVLSTINSPSLSPILLLCTPGSDPEKIVSAACNVAVEQPDALGDQVLSGLITQIASHGHQSVSGPAESGLLSEVIDACLPAAPLRAVSLGTAQSAAAAESALSAGLRTGLWVLLRNAHLDSHWLESTLKRLHASQGGRALGSNPTSSSSFHPAFRLILTAEVPHYSTLEAAAATAGAMSPLARAAVRPSPLPPSVLRMSSKVVLEAPQDFSSSVSRLLLLLEPHKWSRPSGSSTGLSIALAPRLFLLLAWLHAVILQKLRYVPLRRLGSGGWTKAYEFSDSDFVSATAMAETLLLNGGTASPSEIIQALRRLVVDTIYGARLESLADTSVLVSLSEHILCEAALGEGYALTLPLDKQLNGLLAPKEGEVITPDVSIRSREALVHWVDTSISESYNSLGLRAPPPSWFGVPDSSEDSLQARQSLLALNTSNSLTALSCGPTDAASKRTADRSQSSSSSSLSKARSSANSLSPQELSSCHAWATTHLASLAKPPVTSAHHNLSDASKKGDETISSIFNLFLRESEVTTAMLEQVRSDLMSIQSATTSQSSPTQTAKASAPNGDAVVLARALVFQDPSAALPASAVWRKLGRFSKTDGSVDAIRAISVLNDRVSGLSSAIASLQQTVTATAGNQDAGTPLIDLSLFSPEVLVQLQHALAAIYRDTDTGVRLVRTSTSGLLQQPGLVLALGGLQLCGGALGDDGTLRAGESAEDRWDPSVCLVVTRGNKEGVAIPISIFAGEEASQSSKGPTALLTLAVSVNGLTEEAATIWKSRNLSLKVRSR